MTVADHDLLIKTSIQSNCDHDWIEDEGKIRLRKLEDSALQARTVVSLAKATLGMVSVGIIVQVAVALHLI
jgi:hypothetical protein